MSRTRRGVRSAVLPAAVAAAVLACAGCGTAVEAATTPPDPGTTSSTPASPEPGNPAPPSNVPGPGHARLVTAKAGAANPRPVGWSQAQPMAGNTVRLYYWGGACDQVDHVAATWTATTVTLTLYIGTDPARVGRACPDYAAAMAVDAKLTKPLGGRQILDGSATGTDDGHRPVITSPGPTNGPAAA